MLGYSDPDGCPLHGSMTSISLPFTGSPRYRFPCFNGTMKMCDSLRPSHRASLPSLGNTRRCACRFAPSGPRRATVGQGFDIRSPLPDFYAWRRSGPPRFPGNPCAPMPCSPTPAGPTRLALGTLVGAAPAMSKTKAPTINVISGLNRTALELAVYASCGRSPGPHATLASGCWPALPDGIDYPQGSSERFPRIYISFPLPELAWRKDILYFSAAHLAPRRSSILQTADGTRSRSVFEFGALHGKCPGRHLKSLAPWLPGHARKSGPPCLF